MQAVPCLSASLSKRYSSVLQKHMGNSLFFYQFNSALQLCLCQLYEEVDMLVGVNLGFFLIPTRWIQNICMEIKCLTYTDMMERSIEDVFCFFLSRHRMSRPIWDVSKLQHLSGYVFPYTCCRYVKRSFYVFKASFSHPSENNPVLNLLAFL